MNITESPKEHLLQLAAMNFSNREHFGRAAQAMKSIEISSVIQLPADIYEMIQKLKRKLVLKACFENAYILATRIPGVEYVEGYYEVHGIPLEHAFNNYNGIYFDAANELLSAKMPDYDYWMVIEVSNSQLYKMVLELQHYSSMMPMYYKMFVKGKE